MAQMSNALAKRPSLVTFAGIMLVLLGGFQIAWALTELFNAPWMANTAYGTYGGYLWIWGIFDLLFALIIVYAGFDLLRGGAFGQFFGIGIAGVSALRWFFLLPVVPLGAVVVILIDVLILYGILSNSEYFASRSDL